MKKNWQMNDYDVCIGLNTQKVKLVEQYRLSQ